jgi:hypothetical protein
MRRGRLYLKGKRNEAQRLRDFSGLYSGALHRRIVAYLAADPVFEKKRLTILL